MPLQDDLWTRLEALNLDAEGDAFPFSARLARENNWTPEFARRVVREYKKFLYLAMRAGHPISPSDSVDEVWHLHLVYTRSYWDELCPKVLGAPFHHEPSRGGSSEDQKFESWYAQTLQSYRRLFGEEPPGDIWPCVPEYVAPLSPHPQINVERGEESPRFDFAKFRLKLWPALFLVSILAGCSQSLGLGHYDWYEEGLLPFFWVLAVIAFLFSFRWWENCRLPDDENFPSSPLDPYALARLKNAGDLPVDCAVASLCHQKKITVSRSTFIERVDDVPPEHSFEKRVWEKIDDVISLYSLRQALRETSAQFDEKLQREGLLVSSELKNKAISVPRKLAFGLIGFGAFDIVLGLFMGLPVGYFFLSCGFSLAVALWFFNELELRHSRRGQAYLAYLTRITPRTNRVDAASLTPAQLVVAMVLFDYAELYYLGMGHLQPVFKPTLANSNSGDSGGYGTVDSGEQSSNAGHGSHGHGVHGHSDGGHSDGGHSAGGHSSGGHGCGGHGCGGHGCGGHGCGGGH